MWCLGTNSIAGSRRPVPRSKPPVPSRPRGIRVGQLTRSRRLLRRLERCIRHTNLCALDWTKTKITRGTYEVQTTVQSRCGGGRMNRFLHLRPKEKIEQSRTTESDRNSYRCLRWVQRRENYGDGSELFTHRRTPWRARRSQALKNKHKDRHAHCNRADGKSRDIRTVRLNTAMRRLARSLRGHCRGGLLIAHDAHDSRIGPRMMLMTPSTTSILAGIS